MLENLLQPLPFAQLITALFLSVLFLQSGLDKIFDFAGNVSWLTGHFSKSPLRTQVKQMVIVITITEMLAGALSLLGAARIAFYGDTHFALYGAQVAAINVLLLFFGQRIAKEYVGAAVLVPYFILCIGAVLLMSCSGTLYV